MLMVIIVVWRHKSKKILWGSKVKGQIVLAEMKVGNDSFSSNWEKESVL